MSAKNETEVLIGGKTYTLSGYESEEYLQKVALYINGKITDFKKSDVYRRQTADVQATLLELNIADDYFKAKKKASNLEEELERKEKELQEEIYRSTPFTNLDEVGDYYIAGITWDLSKNERITGINIILHSNNHATTNHLHSLLNTTIYSVFYPCF